MIASMIRRATPIAASTLCLMVAAGCKPPSPPPEQKADYSQTLNKYYEGRPLCLWQETVKFPVASVEPETVERLGLNELAESGLLVAKPAGHGARTFDLSPEGRTAFNPDIFQPGAGNFCYGRRKVVSIDAARRNSSTTELVDYHYSVLQPAAWAMESPIQAAFPNVSLELAGTHTAQATLLDTTGGWEISGTPAVITPPVTRPPRASALAKAKSLLGLRRRSG